MDILYPIFGIITILCLLFYFWLVKRKLEEVLEKVRSIQLQLKAVDSMEETDTQSRKEAFEFCKGVEKAITRRYLALVKQPQNYIVAKIYGYPTQLTTPVMQLEQNK